MRNDLTKLVFLVDRSGSMGFNGFNKQMEEAITGIVHGQTQLPGECVVDTFLFDYNRPTNIRSSMLSREKVGPSLDLVRQHASVNVANFRDFRIEPRGGTPLIDAACKAIDIIGGELSRTLEKNRPSKVIFVIVTDGEENSSKEFNLENLKERIAHQTDVYAWTFMFVGADIDGYGYGQSLGTSHGHSYSIGKTEDGTQEFTKALTCKIGTMRGLDRAAYEVNAKTANLTGFTDEERAVQAKAGAK